MSRRKSVLISFLTLFAGLIAVAPAASAGTGQLPNQVTTATQHSNAGYLTQADRSWLQANPEFGAMVIDPAKTTTTISTQMAPQASAAAAATGCASQDVGQSAYTTLGNLAYRYNTHVRWCWSGSTVTSVPERYGYFSNLDGTQYPRGVLVDTTNAGPGSQKTAVTQQTIENCVLKYGCIFSHSPKNTVIMQPNGFVKPTFQP